MASQYRHLDHTSCNYTILSVLTFSRNCVCIFLCDPGLELQEIFKIMLSPKGPSDLPVLYKVTLVRTDNHQIDIFLNQIYLIICVMYFDQKIINHCMDP